MPLPMLIIKPNFMYLSLLGASGMFHQNAFSGGSIASVYRGPVTATHKIKLLYLYTLKIAMLKKFMIVC